MTFYPRTLVYCSALVYCGTAEVEEECRNLSAFIWSHKIFEIQLGDLYQVIKYCKGPYLKGSWTLENPKQEKSRTGGVYKKI